MKSNIPYFHDYKAHIKVLAPIVILMTQDIKEGKETVKAVYIFHLNTHSFIRKIHVLLSLKQSGSLSLTHLLKYDGNIPLLSSADFQNCTI